MLADQMKRNNKHRMEVEYFIWDIHVLMGKTHFGFAFWLVIW